MSDSNKNLVMGPRWGPGTTTDWQNDRRPQNNLILNLNLIQSRDKSQRLKQKTAQCEQLLREAGAEERGQFGIPTERECPPLEALKPLPSSG
jgi:hypothetical protein